MNSKSNIMIMGSRGFKRNYGGWETFVQNLIGNWKNDNTQFYVLEIIYNKKEQGIINTDGVICPQIYTKARGSATMPIFCLKSLLYAIKYKKENNLQNVIFYIIGLRLGPVFQILRPYLRAKKIHVIINPDGLEWKRAKWNWFVKQYFKISESTMLKNSDYIVCDSEGIRSYIKQKYPKLKAPCDFISYGAYPVDSEKMTSEAIHFLEKNHVKPFEYFLIVGRFVPENNYELMIREFMKSSTSKKLLIICNYEKNTFYNELLYRTGFDKDQRIIFAGTLYDKSGLECVRSHAFAYIHGHSAGGTNPSLLEAMSTTKLNLLYNVVFNQEVGQDAAMYFDEKEKPLSELIDYCDRLPDNAISESGIRSKRRMAENYTWDLVVEKHETLFNKILRIKV